MQPVELTVAAEYCRLKGPCFFVENSLVTGVLGLAIWDIIFAPIEGAFFHPFQSAPADFYEPTFTKDRAAQLKQRWAEIHGGKLTEVVKRNFDEKNGLSNPLVNWRKLSQELLILSLRRIPTSDWINLFDYMLVNLRDHRSGLPDLIMFPDTGGYQLIEVKGPGDTLQKNQTRWMNYFMHCGIDCQVTHVQWIQSHREVDIANS